MGLTLRVRREVFLGVNLYIFTQSLKLVMMRIFGIYAMMVVAVVEKKLNMDYFLGCGDDNAESLPLSS